MICTFIIQDLFIFNCLWLVVQFQTTFQNINPSSNNDAIFSNGDLPDVIANCESDSSSVLLVNQPSTDSKTKNCESDSSSVLLSNQPSTDSKTKNCESDSSSVLLSNQPSTDTKTKNIESDSSSVLLSNQPSTDTKTKNCESDFSSVLLSNQPSTDTKTINCESDSSSVLLSNQPSTDTKTKNCELDSSSVLMVNQTSTDTKTKNKFDISVQSKVPHESDVFEMIQSCLISSEDAIFGVRKKPSTSRVTYKLFPPLDVNNVENCSKNTDDFLSDKGVSKDFRTTVQPQEIVKPTATEINTEIKCENDGHLSINKEKFVASNAADKVIGRGLLKYAVNSASLNLSASDACVSSMDFKEYTKDRMLIKFFVKIISDINFCSSCQKNIDRIISNLGNLSFESSVVDCNEDNHESLMMHKSAKTQNDFQLKDSKVSELISAGSLNISQTLRVYYSGSSHLNCDDLIFDERDIKMYLNPYMHRELVRVLDTKLFITRLQSYLWPLAANGQSCLVVGDKRCGKTKGIIVPVLSLILESFFNDDHPDGALKPSTIIICFGWENVKSAVDLIADLSPPGMLKISHAWGSVDKYEEQSLKIQLLSGTDIFITTFPCFQKLFLKQKTPDDESLECFSIENCTRLILDDLDQLCHVFPNCIFQLIEKWNDKKDIPLKQFIATSSTWFKEAHKVLDVINYLNPNLIISSYLEAVIACQINTIVYYCRRVQNPIDITVDLVKEYFRKKIIIITYDESCLNVLKQSLAGVSIWGETVTCSDLMWEINRNITEWKEITSKILIVCDKPFNPLLKFDVRDANVLIQIGLPPSKTQFGSRYSLMLDNYPASVGCKENKAICHLILTEEAVMNNGYILKELERMGASPPVEMDNLKDAVFELKKKKEKNVSLCHYIKAFGECNILNCKWRHYLTEEDYSIILPLKGNVSLDIVSVIDASRYLVRLTSYFSSKGEVDLTKYYTHLFAAMQEYFTSPSNRVVLKFVQEGDLCSVQITTFWARAKVLNVDYSKEKIEVTVFLIDEGSVMIKTTQSVYKLPEAFFGMPQLITEVYLCNIRPVDQDISWTLNASNYVKDLLLSNKNSISYVGKVMLSLKNTLWLSPLTGRKKVLESVVTQRSIKSGLLSLKFGIDHPEHLIKLTKMVFEKGFYSQQEIPEKDEDFWISDYDKGLQSLQTFAGLTSLSFPSKVLSDEVEDLNTSIREELAVTVDEIVEPLNLNEEVVRKCDTKENRIADEMDTSQENAKLEATSDNESDNTLTLKSDDNESISCLNSSISSSINKNIEVDTSEKDSFTYHKQFLAKLKKPLAKARSSNKSLERVSSESELQNVLPLTKNNVTSMYGDKHNVKSYSSIRSASTGSTSIDNVSCMYRDKHNAMSHSSIRSASTGSTSIDNVSSMYGDKHNAKSHSSIRSAPTGSTSIGCEDTSNVRHPSTFWKQDKKFIFIKFQLIDVQDYEHQITDNSLMFSTIIKDLEYHFKETFYSYVDQKDYHINIFGSSVVIKLKKLKEGRC
ncbi:putative ATP-dependent RNA helicase TDRD12 [Armadillidium vulgare]|nr:putative ATP-dependent RNA helicase TDRD12 [Armadillidium vulgare]